MLETLISKSIDALEKLDQPENSVMLNYLVEVLKHEARGPESSLTGAGNLRFIDQIIQVYLNSFELSVEAKQYLAELSQEIGKALTRQEGKQRLFLSYAWNDDPSFVEDLYLDLIRNGFDVWWDKARLPSRGLPILQELRDAILSQVDRVIPIIGPAALQSLNVQYEWDYARKSCKTINPILRVGSHADIPADFQRLLYIDFRQEKREYQEALQDFLRVLSDPVRPLGTAWGVPSSPPHHLPRAEAMMKLEELVLSDILHPVAEDVNQHVTILYGMGGVGKSVLAASFAQSCEVRRTFRDGIIWVTAGQEGDIPQKLLYLGTLLNDDISRYSTYIFAKARLSELLKDKNCLIVLDDVWDVTHADVFRDMLGENCRMLVTTRDAGLATALGAKQLRLDVLNHKMSLELLAEWTRSTAADLPTEASEIIDECGNLPFALALCGAMVRDGVLWSDLLDALHDADLSFIERRFPNYPYPNLLRALKVSVDLLSPDDFDSYKKLVVFEKDIEIPEETVLLLWLHSHDISPRKARKLITDLDQKALIRLEGEAPNRRIHLHDLNHDYLLSVLENTTGLHEEILDAYSARCPDGWYTGPDDGYFFDYVAFHLIKAGRVNEFGRTLKDLRYIVRKTFLRNSLAVETDFILADKYLPDDLVLRYLKRHYINAGHILNQCQSLNDLIATFHSRIKDIESISHLTTSLLSLLQTPNLQATHVLPDLPHPGLIRTLYAHTDFINACIMSDDRSLLVSASQDRTTKIWGGETGIEKHEIKEDPFAAACSFNRNHKLLATLTENGELHVYETSDFRRIKTLVFENHKPTTFSFITNRLLALGTAQGQLVLFDIELTAAEKIIQAHSLTINEIAVSEDSQVMVSASDDKTLKLWRVEDGSDLGTLYGHNEPVLGCSISPNNSLVISSSADHTAKIWDVTLQKEIRTLNGHSQPVYRCRISRDGAYVVTCSGEEKIQGHIGTLAEMLVCDHTVKLWDAKTGDILQTFTGHTGLISDVRISRDGSMILSGSHDGTLRIWDALNRETYAVQDGHTNWVMDCDISPDGSLAVSGSDDGTIKMWDPATGVVKATLMGHHGDVNNVHITPDMKYILSASYDGTARIWDIENQESILTLDGHSGPLWDCDLSPDGKTLVTASYDKTICTWDRYTGVKLKTLLGHAGKVRRCTFSRDGAYLISVSQDQSIKIWDAITGECVRTLLGHTDQLNRCELSHDGAYIVSTSEDNTLRVWDFATGLEKLTLSGHKEKVRGCSVSRDNKLIASTSEDCSLKIWNAQTGSCLATLHVDGPLFGCAWSPDNVHLVATGARGVYFLEYHASLRLPT